MAQIPLTNVLTITDQHDLQKRYRPAFFEIGVNLTRIDTLAKTLELVITADSKKTGNREELHRIRVTSEKDIPGVAIGHETNRNAVLNYVSQRQAVQNRIGSINERIALIDQKLLDETLTQGQIDALESRKTELQNDLTVAQGILGNLTPVNPVFVFPGTFSDYFGTYFQVQNGDFRITNAGLTLIKNLVPELNAVI